MSGQQVSEIVAGDESEIHDEPHVAGSRLTVRFIQRKVDDAGLSVEAVAERFERTVGSVYAALAYYHAHPEEMAAVEARRE